MKLLILTQKVDINDDGVLGFFHDWINEFAKYCEQVTVVCLYKGEFDLPENVKVLSLGKERISQKSVKSKVHKVRSIIIQLILFYKFIWQERKNYDTVFVHMNQIYIVLGGLYWRAMNKKIALWFTHKSVNLTLRIAEKLADIVFTASQESFRIDSAKIRVVGHGIDTDKFYNGKAEKISDRFRLITVGRISPSKDYETLIKAIEAIYRSGEIIDFEVRIVGGPGRPEQERYFEKLKKLVSEKGLDLVIKFVGAIPAGQRYGVYKNADLFVHMSQTGSLDKVVLEAMASSMPIVTCNEAVLNDVLGEYKNVLGYEIRDYLGLAERIKYIHGLSQSERNLIGESLRQIVIKNHDQKSLIMKLIKEMNGSASAKTIL
jgi:glycosyltransferase involved in cell wall biosynthesis